jgi:hypothetical protein
VQQTLTEPRADQKPFRKHPHMTTDSIDLEAPLFADTGVGGMLSAAAKAYREDYVFSTEGPDHEPTEFEAVLLEDFEAGLFSDERINALLNHLVALARSREQPEGAMPDAMDRDMENVWRQAFLTHARARSKQFAKDHILAESAEQVAYRALVKHLRNRAPAPPTKPGEED